MELHKYKSSLEDGYLLHWYKIIKVIGRGGFGITYLARDTNLERDVAIKEFMPEEFAVRETDSTVHPKTDEQGKIYSWGLERFIAEARTLAKFNHPNIVRVQSVFEENNTAYMVMEYAKGKDLSKVYKNEPQISEEQLLDTFVPILDGLSLVHNAGFIHRDIKPANIYICDHNIPLLLDFGSARQSIGNKTKALTSLVTFGYAPFEQYNEGSGKQGPWTDIYSLGASIYVGITGKKPADALYRGGSFLEKGIDTYEPVSILAKGEYSENFLLAIDKALMFKIDDRPKNIILWADMLLGKAEAPALPDYLLNPPETDNETELVWTDTELGYNTNISSNSANGTQGLVDAYGKRAIPTTDTVIRTNKKPHNKPQQNFTPPPADKHFNRSAISFIKKGKYWLAPLVLIIFSLLLLIMLNFETENSIQRNTDNKDVNKPEIKTTKETIDALNNNLIEDLFSRAEYAFKTGNFTRPETDNAFKYYKKIISLYPGNQKALNAIQTMESTLLEMAYLEFELKNYENSRDYLLQINGMGKNPLEVESLLEKINQLQAQELEISSLVNEAENHLKNNRYTAPDDNNAFLSYNKILNIQTENEIARQGLKTIKEHYITLFNKHIEAAQFKKAKSDLAIMRAISTPEIDINKMQTTLSRSMDKATIKNKTVKKKVANKKVIRKSIKKLNIEQVSSIIEKFKNAMQDRKTKKVTSLSEFIPGRKQFVHQLHKQYQSINVKISKLRLIQKNNRAQVHIELTALVDINGHSVVPGNWNSFDVTIKYNQQNQLKIYW